MQETEKTTPLPPPVKTITEIGTLTSKQLKAFKRRFMKSTWSSIHTSSDQSSSPKYPNLMDQPSLFLFFPPILIQASIRGGKEIH